MRYNLMRYVIGVVVCISCSVAFSDDTKYKKDDTLVEAATKIITFDWFDDDDDGKPKKKVKAVKIKPKPRKKRSSVWDGYYWLSITTDGKRMIFHQKVQDASNPPSIKRPLGEWFDFLLKYLDEDHECLTVLRSGRSSETRGQDNLEESHFHSRKAVTVKDINNKPLQGAFWLSYYVNPEGLVKLEVYAMTDEKGVFSFINVHSSGYTLDSFLFHPSYKTVYRFARDELDKYDSGKSISVIMGRPNIINVGLTVQDVESKLPVKAEIKFLNSNKNKTLEYDGKNMVKCKIKYDERIEISAKGYAKGEFSLRPTANNQEFTLQLYPHYVIYNCQLATSGGIPLPPNTYVQVVAQAAKTEEVIERYDVKTDNGGKIKIKVKEINEDKYRYIIKPLDENYTYKYISAKSDKTNKYFQLEPRCRDILITGNVVDHNDQPVADAEIKVLYMGQKVDVKRTNDKGEYSVFIQDYTSGKKLSVSASHRNYLSKTRNLFKYDENIKLNYKLIPPKASLLVLLNRSNGMTRLHFLALKNALSSAAVESLPGWMQSALGIFKEDQIDLIAPFSSYKSAEISTRLAGIRSITANGGCDMINILNKIPETMIKFNAAGAGENKSRVVIFTCNDYLIESLSPKSKTVLGIINRFKKAGLELHVILITMKDSINAPVFRSIAESTGGKIYSITRNRSSSALKKSILNLYVMQPKKQIKMTPIKNDDHNKKMKEKNINNISSIEKIKKQTLVTRRGVNNAI